jgi:hypothetical protein
VDDYEDERQVLIGLAEAFGVCHCDEAYSKRGLEDPFCRYHERIELVEDILIWLKERDKRLGVH